MNDETFATFWGHFEDLRRTLLRVFLIIISATIICFLNYEPILSLLTKPLSLAHETGNQEEHLTYFRIHNPGSVIKKIDFSKEHLVSKNLSENVQFEGGKYSISPGGSLVYAKIKPNQQLVLLSPLEGILFSLKTSLWSGIFISSPLWLYVLSRFFLPGLKTHEKSLILPFIIVSLLFVTTGCLFAYFVTIPIANEYLINFNQNIGTNLWSLGNYLDYTLFLLMANGIAFELGVIGIFAVHLQVLSAEILIRNRRFAIVAAFILAAILTPPDILTQFLLAVPLIALYEMLIVYSNIFTTEHTENIREM